MPHDLSQERVSRLTGIALMCGAVACFALLDTTAKYLNLYMSTLQVVWARYTGAFLFPFIISNPWTRPGLTRTKRPVLQLARSVLLLASTLCNFAALRYLQLRRDQRSGTLIADLWSRAQDRNTRCLSSGGKANFRCPVAHR